MRTLRDAYILGAYRTPSSRTTKFGRFGKGRFKDLRPDDLASIAIKGLIERLKIDPFTIDDVILGCAFPEAEQGLNIARISLLKAGLSVKVPGFTLNRLCSSSLESIAIACERIMVGLSDCIIAGGVESMSMVPMGGVKYSLNPDLMEDWPQVYTPMGLTAEFVAEKHNITRLEQDEFALNSHLKALKATEEGKFKDEIIPVAFEAVVVNGFKVKKEKIIVENDDGIRGGTTLETLSKLKPIFKKDGSVTAGNSSQMSDASSVILAVSEDYLKKLAIPPLAKFVGYAVKGVEPHMMGEGPIAAVPKLFETIRKFQDIKMDDVGLIEFNEAFAAQVIACVKALGWGDLTDIINVNGGAVALGHPLGATGGKLAATLLHEMKRRKVKYGLETMCVGGGMGAACLFELV